MEAFIVLFLLFGGWRLIIWLLKIGSGAVADVAKGQATFKESVQARVQPPSDLEMRVMSTTIGEDDIAVWRVEARGLFRISTAKNLGLVVSLLDSTEQGNAHPILTAFEQQQEPNTRAFQAYSKFGLVEPGQGFLHWQQVGLVAKDPLMFPYSGERDISFVARLVDLDNPPEILNGFSDAKQAGLIQTLVHKEQHKVVRGFLEHSEEELGIAAASIRLGLALAYSDGRFDPSEGRLIKEWAAKFVNDIPEGSGRDKAKSFINDAIRFGNEDASSSILSVDNQVKLINQLAERPQKYAAIELCLDVMAADGTAEQAELKILNDLCKSLGLDPDRFGELRDQRMIATEFAQVDGSNIWEALGIDSNSSEDEKKGKLKQMYRRWNAGAESLEDPAEREKAHQMLELIAEAKRLLNAQ